MNKGIRCRIYPNKEQQTLINQTFGCCRLIYNLGLTMRDNAYRVGTKVGYCQTSKMLTDLKQDVSCSYLKNVDSIALQQSLRDLDIAYKRFFQKLAKHPKYKSKHNHHQSYRTINQNNSIRIVGKYIKLPKLGYVKIKQSMPIENIKNVTVEKTPTGKYFVVINVEFEPVFKFNLGNSIGIDVGIKCFYTDSNGNTVDNPKHLEHSMRKLVREQRKLSHKHKSSNNYNKQRIKVAHVHEQITNQRNDFLQKQSTILISENQTICIEDLQIKNMVRNHKLALHISSASWAKFFNMLEYKATWYGNVIIKVPTTYPSSQTCSYCGYKNPLIKNLAIRKWECPRCYTKHDRDVNASINILNKGLAMLVA